MKNLDVTFHSVEHYQYYTGILMLLPIQSGAELGGHSPTTSRLPITLLAYQMKPIGSWIILMLLPATKASHMLATPQRARRDSGDSIATNDKTMSIKDVKWFIL